MLTLKLLKYKLSRAHIQINFSGNLNYTNAT